LRAIVYIDGFNLYYGAVRNSAYKWLNLWEFSSRLIPRHNLIAVKYYTARVSGRPKDPDAPTRQNTWFRALQTVPGIEIHLGHFLVNARTLAREDGKGYARVLVAEEKGSDVNLASHLLVDGFSGAFELAVVITNDSDLAEPIRLVQGRGLPVWVFAPLLTPGRRPSNVLKKTATEFRSIRWSPIKQSQFPDELNDAQGKLRKPGSW